MVIDDISKMIGGEEVRLEENRVCWQREVRILEVPENNILSWFWSAG
jgi:hypothetical protein